MVCVLITTIVCKSKEWMFISALAWSDYDLNFKISTWLYQHLNLQASVSNIYVVLLSLMKFNNIEAIACWKTIHSSKSQNFPIVSNCCWSSNFLVIYSRLPIIGVGGWSGFGNIAELELLELLDCYIYRLLLLF